MNKTWQWIKSTILFIAGIVLIVWGYQANASNNNDRKEAAGKNDEQQPQPAQEKVQEKAQGSDAVSGASKKEKEAKTEDEQPASDAVSGPTKKAPADTLQKKGKKLPDTQKKVEKKKKAAPKDSVQAKKTVIESGEKAEESSSTK